MSIVQTLVGAIVSSGSSAPTTTYTMLVFLSGAPGVSEGAAVTCWAGGTNVPDDTYYWTIETNSGDFVTTSGTVSVTGTTGPYLGSFTVTPTEDATTEGAETFTVALRSGSITGPILATSDPASIIDTSLNPTTGSFVFTAQTSQYITLGGNISDWALDKTGTIEWWQKAPGSNSFGGNFNGGMITQGNQGGTGGLDIFAAGGNIAMGLGAAGVMPFVVEPASTTTWTHVAISFAPNPDNLNVGKSRVYFNGVEQSINNNSVLLSNSTDEIHIGSRVPDANYQNWTGKITNIHFSTAELYTSNFTPTIRTTATTGTVFLMNSDSPTTDISGRHTITGGIYTLSADVVNLRTATHSAVNQGSTNVHIDTNPTNDAWAGSVTVGASIISQFSGRFTVNSKGRDANNNWVFYIGAGPVGGFTAGETHTFIW